MAYDKSVLVESWDWSNPGRTVWETPSLHVYSRTLAMHGVLLFAACAFWGVLLYAALTSLA